MKRLSTLAALAILAVISLSCSKDDGKTGKPNPVKNYSATLPASGGTLDFGMVRIVAPAGAVSEDRKISLAMTTEAKSIDDGGFRNADGARMLLPGDPVARLDFGPEGLIFDEPVEVQYPQGVMREENVDVLWYNKETGQWVSRGPVRIEDGMIHFSLEHFSTYVVVNIGMEAMSRIEGAVMVGLRSGTPPAVIAESFHEQAVNGEGRELMRRPYKDLWTGLFYEPFYSFCSISWCVYADGIESDPGSAEVHKIGSRPENASFRGCFKTASYHSQYDTFEEFNRKLQNTTVEEKRRTSMKLFSSLVEIFYRLAKPRITLTQDKELAKKGDEATVTVTVEIFDPVQNDYIPYDYVDIQLSNSDGSVVRISKDEVVTGSDGTASFKITALKDDGESVISANFHKEGALWDIQDDVVDATGTLSVSFGDAWELEFSCNYSNKATGTVSETAFDNPKCNCPEQSFACEMQGSAKFTVSFQKGKAGEILAGYLPASFYKDFADQQMEAYVVKGKCSVRVPESSVSLSFPEVKSSYTYDFDYSTYTVRHTATFDVDYHLHPRTDIDFSFVADNLDKGILIYFISPFAVIDGSAGSASSIDKTVLYFSGSSSVRKTDSGNGSDYTDSYEMNSVDTFPYMIAPEFLAISLTEGTFPLTCYPEHYTDGGDPSEIMFSTDTHFNYAFADPLPIGAYYSCVDIDYSYHPQASGSITIRKTGSGKE
ncbi:MAG: hypothetical protein IJ686_00400 [Bacteroidales bacterium]|nr:hypothetical protein [Bacteroidales bacterium]